MILLLELSPATSDRRQLAEGYLREINVIVLGQTPQKHVPGRQTGHLIESIFVLS